MFGIKILVNMYRSVTISSLAARGRHFTWFTNQPLDTDFAGANSFYPHMYVFQLISWVRIQAHQCVSTEFVFVSHVYVNPSTNTPYI